MFLKKSELTKIIKKKWGAKFPPKKRNKPEAIIQTAFFEKLEKYFPELNEVTFAIPNGGARHIVVAMDLKAQGVKAGIPDVFMAVPSKGLHGLFIEFKAPKGKTSDLQEHKIKKLKERSYEVIVCYSVEDALKGIEAYLGQ